MLCCANIQSYVSYVCLNDPRHKRAILGKEAGMREPATHPTKTGLKAGYAKEADYAMTNNALSQVD
jgi:hypothetical protein